MKRCYRHRGDRYEIEAEYCENAGYYIIHKYRCGEDNYSSITLRANDFVQLFERCPEYCCEPFKKMLNRDAFYQGCGGDWFSRKEGGQTEMYTCPFCEKLLDKTFRPCE